MLKMIWIVILIIFASFSGSAQEENFQRLFPFKKDKKCGYINQKGVIIVPPQFDFCDSFNEGMAGVSLSDKSGYIDETGKIVIPIQFDSFFPEYFMEGLAPIKLRKEDGKLEVGYVDKAGKIRLLPEVSEGGFFSEGLAVVKKDGKSGYINKDLKFIIPPKFDFARSFANGRAWVVDKSGEYYIDTSGRQVISDFGTNGSDFSEGLATFISKYFGYGYIDVNGKIAIKKHFNYACLFSEGLACVQDFDGKWGYIDKSGNYLIPPQFDEAEDFSSDGIAVVKVNEKYGFINRKGEFIISPQFEKAEWLNGIGLVEINGQKKYINNMNQSIFQLTRN